METEIKIPVDLWEEESEAVITEWLVDDGGEVSTGDVLAEIMTEKIQLDIEAPADGSLKITKKIDEVINKGDVIGVIES